MRAVTAETVRFANIRRWLARYLRQLDAFSAEEYVVLRDELRDPTEYGSRLDLLDSHLAQASKTCANFDQLISERKQVGTDRDEANRTVLDKLAEIRAIVGLEECGFSSIQFVRSPDLLAEIDGLVLPVEVTRISAPGGPREPPEDVEVSVVFEGDDTDVMWRQLITKMLAKRERLLRTPYAHLGHMVWVSTGRGYFTAGRYESSLAGLRLGMPKHLRFLTELASSDPRIREGYPELKYLAVSPGGDAKPQVFRVSH
jgi:hypothetical protein